MSDYATLRDAISAAVSGVTNVGIVHTRERIIADQSKFLEAFVSSISGTTQVRGWVVTIDDGLTARNAAFGIVERSYNFVVYGVMSAQDAASTEHTFYDLVEAIMDALDDLSPTLGLSGVVAHDHGPARARNMGYRTFGSVLCHYVEIPYSVMVDKS